MTRCDSCPRALVIACSRVRCLGPADPLPSWHDTAGAAKSGDRGLRRRASPTPAEPRLSCHPSERIATFDNDGTLWAEQPAYFQLLFAVDRIAELAAADPAVASSPALEAAAKRDFKALLESGEKGLLEVVSRAHSAIDVDGFQAEVARWLAETRHPKTGKRYDEMVYQPMLELLSYLRDKGFKTYIVSGGGIHFMRVFAEDAYGIPPEQVIGTVAESSYRVEDGKPVIMKEPGIAFLDDKEGKPVAIDRVIGRRPILAGGNSDGDRQMIEWTTAGDGRRLGLLVHHTDDQREWAYDRESHIGKLDKALDQAKAQDWTLVDMKTDWRVVFPYELAQ